MSHPFTYPVYAAALIRKSAILCSIQTCLLLVINPIASTWRNQPYQPKSHKQTNMRQEGCNARGGFQRFQLKLDQVTKTHSLLRVNHVYRTSLSLIRDNVHTNRHALIDTRRRKWKVIASPHSLRDDFLRSNKAWMSWSSCSQSLRHHEVRLSGLTSQIKLPKWRRRTWCER